MRQGAAKDIHLERFVQALEDPSSGLTYAALTGVRKWLKTWNVWSWSNRVYGKTWVQGRGRVREDHKKLETSYR